MKVYSIVAESVASPRTKYDKSATLRPDLEGELLRRAIGHMMDDFVRTDRHGAFKGDSWPSAEDLPLQTSPIRESNPRTSNQGTFIGTWEPTASKAVRREHG